MVMVVIATACISGRSDGFGGDANVSDFIFIGENRFFESQEAAEAILTARGVPFTVVEAGSVSGHRWRNEILAIVEDAQSSSDLFGFMSNAQRGYYVPRDQTVLLMVYTSVELELLDESENVELEETQEVTQPPTSSSSAPQAETGLVTQRFKSISFSHPSHLSPTFITSNFLQFRLNPSTLMAFDAVDVSRLNRDERSARQEAWFSEFLNLDPRSERSTRRIAGQQALMGNFTSHLGEHVLISIMDNNWLYMISIVSDGGISDNDLASFAAITLSISFVN